MDDSRNSVTRRHFFRQAGFGIGSAALSLLLDRDLFARQSATAPAPGRTHFPPKAKSVIYLFMAGGPSQLDLFDPKPKLRALDGTGAPEEIVKGERFAFVQGNPRLLGSPYAFRKHGRSGIEMSELLPHLSTVADDLAVVRTVHTTQFNHAPAQLFMNTGDAGMHRPSLGSWLTYGIGSENENLPGFVVLASGQFNPEGGKSCWGNGFLPTAHQGVEFRSKGDPVLFLNNPEGIDAGA